MQRKRSEIGTYHDNVIIYLAADITIRDAAIQISHILCPMTNNVLTCALPITPVSTVVVEFF